jgi:hypothetical protein
LQSAQIIEELKKKRKKGRGKTPVGLGAVALLHRTYNRRARRPLIKDLGVLMLSQYPLHLNLSSA